MHLSNVIHKNTLFLQINPLVSSLYLLATQKKTERASHHCDHDHLLSHNSKNYNLKTRDDNNDDVFKLLMNRKGKKG